MVTVQLRVRYGPRGAQRLDVSSTRATVAAGLACVLAAAVRASGSTLTDFLHHLRVERVAVRMQRRPPGHPLAARVVRGGVVSALRAGLGRGCRRW